MIRAALVAFASALALAACRAPETQAPASALSEHEAGRQVYNARCYFCHGYSGDARTQAAQALDPPPRDFTRAAGLDETRVAQVLRDGIPGTAMKGFGTLITDREARQVARFVIEEFVRARATNTRYHTAENGWPGHERYAAAFPFATGEAALDTSWEALAPEQARGKRLFLDACVSCHDGRRSVPETLAWELRGMSWPPGNYVRDEPGEARDHHHEDEGDPFERHETAPAITGLDARERRGEKVFQSNCAFCHAADGSGRNWIGAFIEPHPADFAAPDVSARLARAYVSRIVRDGIEGTSMPAWSGVLSRAEIEAVAAYAERAFGPGKQVRPRPRPQASRRPIAAL